MSELQQVREEVLLRGTTGLMDSQLLGVALGNMRLARKLCADGAWWKAINGVTDKQRATLKCITELGRRACGAPLTRETRISCSADASEIYRSRMVHLEKEHFIALALNNKNQIISEIKVAIGTFDQALVRSAEVYKALIEAGAARVICIHNHPSGSIDFSPHDIALCRRLAEVGSLVGIDLLDFLVIGLDGYSSARDNGILSEGRCAA